MLRSLEQGASVSGNNDTTNNCMAVSVEADGLQVKTANWRKMRDAKLRKSEKILDMDNSQSYDEAKSCRFSLVNDALSASEEVRQPEQQEYRFDKDTLLKDFMLDHEDFEFVVMPAPQRDSQASVAEFSNEEAQVGKDLQPAQLQGCLDIELI